MKNGIVGLAAVAALAFCGMALAAEAPKANPPATEAAKTEKPAAAAASDKAKAPEKEKMAEKTAPKAAVKFRAKYLDLRHCLDEGDNTAIAKCAGE